MQSVSVLAVESMLLKYMHCTLLLYGRLLLPYIGPIHSWVTRINLYAIQPSLSILFLYFLYFITFYIFAHFLYFPVFFVIVCAVIVRVGDLVTLVIDMFVLVIAVGWRLPFCVVYIQLRVPIKCKTAREQLEAIESNKKSVNRKRKQLVASASEPHNKKQRVPVQDVADSVQL